MRKKAKRIGRKKKISAIIEEEMSWINGWGVSPERFTNLCNNTAEKIVATLRERGEKAHGG